MRIWLSPQKGLAFVVLSCVVVRLLAMIALQSWNLEPRYGFRDGEIGAAIAAGDGFSWPRDSHYYPTNGEPEPTAWQAPVYPYIIAAAFHFLGTFSRASALFLIIFQILISAPVCILLFKLGRRLFNTNTGLLAGLIFALYPPAVHFAIQKIALANLLVFLLLLFLLQLLQLAENPSISKATLAGITFGIGLLTDPTIAGFLPLALGWLFFRCSGEYRRRVTAVAIMLLAICLTISPKLIRDYLMFHHFVFIKSNFTRELFMANYGTSEAMIEERRKMTVLDEGERGKEYTAEFLQSVAQEPVRFAQKILRRVVKFWTTPPVDRSDEEGSGIAERVVILSYFAVLALGAIGIGLTLFKETGGQLILMAILALPIPYYLTWFSRFRYRFPVEPLLIIFAAYTVVWLCQRFLKNRKFDFHQNTHSAQ